MKAKKVKYVVTKPFGTNSLGDVVAGYLLMKDGDNGLIYFPPERKNGLCGSIEICKWSFVHQGYVSISKKIDCYVNQDEIVPEFSKMLKNMVETIRKNE